MMPIALNLVGKKVLIVGGGKVALKRTKKYLQQQANITVVSPQFLAEFNKLPVKCLVANYHCQYLADVFMVYVATDNKKLNQQIMLDCQQRNILAGSANFDQEASFYGMATIDNETGMLAYSTHQRLPYVKPLLKQLSAVIESQQTRLELLMALRPEIIKLPTYKPDIFETLFIVPEEILAFLVASLKAGYGVIFVYHQNRYDNHYDFKIQPAITLSIASWQKYQSLMMFAIKYYVVPLVLADGFIYQEIIKDLPRQFINIGPLLATKADIEYLDQTLTESDNRLWILHNRQNSKLKDLFKKYTHNVIIYDFKDTIKLDKNKKYDLMVILLSHGKHYHDYQELVKEYQRAGYQITFKGNLLDQAVIKTYLENKIKKILNNQKLPIG